MNTIMPFEPAVPAIIVGEAFDGGTPPLGLGEPFALLGGERLGPDGIVFEMLHDHQPDLLGWIASSCGAQLEAERYWFRGAPVILTGPRGCGRTHAARWLARVSGVPHVILNLSDPIIASNLAASRAVGETLWASPVTVAMATTRCANPVVTVLGAEFASDDVTNGFLSMIDPELGAVWREDLLGVQVDMSEVTWVFQGLSVILCARSFLFIRP